MPYIDPKRRDALDNNQDIARTAGELNYQLTMLCDGYLRTHGKCYQTLNDVMGVLSGADKEFYRRVVAPYEDEKIKLNGDVYNGNS